MKVLFGLILSIIGILGIAVGGVDSPRQMIGTDSEVASMVTLGAAFLLVGGLLILARTGKFSPETFRGQAWKVAHGASLPLVAPDELRRNDNTT